MSSANDWPCLGDDDPLHQRAHQKAIRRARDLCLAMPDTAEKISRGHIPIITVGGKSFCMFWRQDKRPNVCVNAAVGAQDALVGAEPERYFVPAYVGGRGWVGIRLDGDVDWKTVGELVRESHRISTPKRTAAAAKKPAAKKPSAKKPSANKRQALARRTRRA